MRNTTLRRVPFIVPVAVAIALSVSACGGHITLSSGADAGATTAPAGSNAANSAGTGAATAASPGQGGFSGNGSGTSSGLASGATGQSGLSGGSSGGSASGSAGQFGGSGGASGGTPGVSTSATGLSPDEVAQYCKSFGGIAGGPGVYNQQPIADQAQAPLRDLRLHTPVQLQQYVDVLATDYKLVANQTRTEGQVRDELVAAFKPLKDLHDQICS